MVARPENRNGRADRLVWFGVLLILTGLFAGMLSQRGTSAVRLAAAPRAVADAPAVPVEPEVARYLAESFCRDGLCNGRDGWQSIVIADAASAWTTEELEMVRTIWLTTLSALDEVGIDGRGLLVDFRVRRLDQAYVHGDAAWHVVAMVNHVQQEIVLSRTAFPRQGASTSITKSPT